MGLLMITTAAFVGFWVGYWLTQRAYKDRHTCDAFRLRTAYDKNADLEREVETLKKQNRQLAAQHLALFEHEVAA